MNTFTLSLAGLLVAGSLATPASAQQNPPPAAPQVKQRAPGVPLAPRTDVARTREQNADPQQRTQAEREPPMPRGVPPIIAP